MNITSYPLHVYISALQLILWFPHEEIVCLWKGVVTAFGTDINNGVYHMR